MYCFTKLSSWELLSGRIFLWHQNDVWVFVIAASKLLLSVTRSRFIVEVKFLSAIGDKTIPQINFKTIK